MARGERGRRGFGRTRSNTLKRRRKQGIGGGRRFFAALLDQYLAQPVVFIYFRFLAEFLLSFLPMRIARRYTICDSGSVGRATRTNALLKKSSSLDFFNRVDEDVKGTAVNLRSESRNMPRLRRAHANGCRAHRPGVYQALPQRNRPVGGNSHAETRPLAAANRAGLRLRYDASMNKGPKATHRQTVGARGDEKGVYLA